jgi:hypothetical protein
MVAGHGQGNFRAYCWAAMGMGRAWVGHVAGLQWVWARLGHGMSKVWAGRSEGRVSTSRHIAGLQLLGNCLNEYLAACLEQLLGACKLVADASSVGFLPLPTPVPGAATRTAWKYAAWATARC